jgi:hypothetical protein
MSDVTSVKPKKKAGKIILGIFIAILAVIAVLAVIVAVIASKNTKAMNRAVDDAMAVISERYNVTEEECGEYSEMTINGIMKFDVKKYDVEGIGNLSVMKMNAGAMQMISLILNPQEKNMPLVSADFMYILSNRKAYYELYDLVETKDEKYEAILDAFRNISGPYDSLEDTSSTPAWFDDLRNATMYKKGKTSDDEALSAMLCDGLEAVLDASSGLPELTEEQKKAKNVITKDYTDGLISNGGISTDMFKSSLGEDVTRDFFSKVLFGTGRMD